MRKTSLILQDFSLVIIDEGQGARKSNHFFNAAACLKRHSSIFVILTATPIMTGPRVCDYYYAVYQQAYRI